MSKKIKKNNLKWIGAFLICVGIFCVFTKVVEVLKNKNATLSIVFEVTLVVTIAYILIGICLMIKRKWSYKIVLVLSSALIIGGWAIGIKMVIYGIFDIKMFQTPGSSIRLMFGLSVLFASIPFFVVNKNINKLMRHKSMP